MTECVCTAGTTALELGVCLKLQLFSWGPSVASDELSATPPPTPPNPTPLTHTRARATSPHTTPDSPRVPQIQNKSRLYGKYEAGNKLDMAQFAEHLGMLPQVCTLWGV
jgi:hypothetical protein